MAVVRTAQPPPLVESDPLVAHILRAAVECYIRGDFHRAANYLLDAAAAGPLLPGIAGLRAFAFELEHQLAEGALVSRDCGTLFEVREWQ